MGENDNETGGDYSNEGRNHPDPTGNAPGNTQSDGGGWMGDVADADLGTSAPQDQSAAETARLDRMNAATSGGYFGGNAPDGGATGATIGQQVNTGLGLLSRVLGFFSNPAMSIAMTGIRNIDDIGKPNPYGKPSYSTDKGDYISASPVIGWKGAIVNRAAPAPTTTRAAAPGDYLGFSAIAPRAQPQALAPQGASREATDTTTGMVGLALGLSLLAVLS